jgi:hypothetical protein
MNTSSRPSPFQIQSYTCPRERCSCVPVVCVCYLRLTGGSRAHRELQAKHSVSYCIDYQRAFEAVSIRLFLHLARDSLVTFRWMTGRLDLNDPSNACFSKIHPDLDGVKLHPN